jgi:hypothetical protein
MLLESYTWDGYQVGLDKGRAARLREERVTVQYAMGITDLLPQPCVWRIHPKTRQDRPETSFRSRLPQM